MELFLAYLVPVKLNKAPAKLDSAQLSSACFYLLLLFIYHLFDSDYIANQTSAELKLS